MFFEEQKKELLLRENIRMNCTQAPKEQVILELAEMLRESGYVRAEYAAGMLEREKSFSTYMGNGLAIPHGVEAAKREILKTGFAVMLFPRGTDWGGERVYVAVGIAAVGEEHLQVLSLIADCMMEEGQGEALANADLETVYRTLTGRDS